MVALAAVACVVSVAGLAGAQTSTAASITSVAAGDTALTVNWSAPSGVAETDIIAYDLRYIETSADETVDANWSMLLRAWTDGPLHYVLTGLTNQVEYAVQVRALTSTTGEWSASATGQPADHGDTQAGATAIGLEVPVGGHISSSTDVEYFRIAVSGNISLYMYSTGTTELNGTLLSSSGTKLASGIPAEHLSGANNFLVGRALSSGTYYLKVEGRDGDLGAYVVNTGRVTRGADFANAMPIEIDSVTYGVLGPDGATPDYYELVLDRSTDLFITAPGSVSDTVGQVFDTDEELVAENDDGYLNQTYAFAIRVRLEAGTYFLTVRGFAPSEIGLYALHVHEVDEPGSTPAAAAPLAYEGAAGGTIASATDEDYFRVEVPQTTLVEFRALGEDVALNGAVLDASLNEIPGGNSQTHVSPYSNLSGVSLFRELEAGTYYFRVDTSGWDPDGHGQSSGAYAAAVFESRNFRRVRTRCGSPPTGVSDPLFGCQWNLDNTGRFNGRAGEDINAVDAWSTTTGSQVNVAIVDSTVDYDHQDLVANLDTSMSHDYGAAIGRTSRAHYHGTAVAGIVAAQDNRFGVRGVAPQATIRGFNLLDAHTLRNEADAMSRNAATTHASSNSWGPRDDGQHHRASRLWELAVETGLATGAGGRGTLYVWAGGNGSYNDNSNLDEYANFWGVTAVCAVNHRGQQSDYSESGANLWVCAPSSDGYRNPGIMSTGVNGSYTADFGGTSASAPQVSGVAALVRSVNPQLTWRDVKLILAGSARRNDASDAGWLTGAPKYEASADSYEFSHRYGFGVVDAAEAVKLAQGWVNVSELTEESAASTGAALVIGDRATAEGSVELGAGVYFTEFVEVSITMDAPNLRSLDLELVSPTGKVSELLVADTDRSSHVVLSAEGGAIRLGSARHLGEDPSGRWTLRVRDQVSGGAVARLWSWSITAYGHRQTTPGPPVITTVDGVTDPLTVTWQAPRSDGGSTITSYDVRHIPSDSADKGDDAAWTLITGAWTSGTLDYTITGLAHGVSVDIEVRAVSADGAGAWSRTARGRVGTFSSAPRFDLGENGMRSIAENVPVGTGVGTPFQASDGDGDSLTYSLSGADAAVFDIVTTTGQLRTTVVHDYETRRRYSLTVSVSDGKDADGNADPAIDDTIAVTLTVDNVDEAGYVTLSSPRPQVGTELAAELDDSDGAIANRSWSWQRSQDQISWSAIRGASADRYTPTEADVGYFLRVSVSYDDGEGAAKNAEQTSTETTHEAPVTNHAPSFADDTAERSVAENSPARTRVGAPLTATDDDNDPLDYSLSGHDAGAFTIDGDGQIRVGDSTTLDHEAQPAYEVVVVATDGQGLTDSVAVAVTVSDVDEGPVVSGSQSLSLAENQATDRVLAVFGAVDPEDPSGQATRWSLSGSDAGDFSVSEAGELLFRKVPDFERPADSDRDNVYGLSVRASDGRSYGYLAVTVTVTDVDEAPEIATVAKTALVYRENGTAVLATFRAVDPEEAVVVWSLSGPDGGHFAIYEGVLTFKRLRDFESPADVDGDNVYEVTVVAADEGLNAGTLAVTVTVTDVDEGPVVSGRQSLSLAENQATDEILATYGAVDPEDLSGPITRWGLSGSDAGDFSVSEAGELSFRKVPDFERPADSDKDNVYSLSVRASDGRNYGYLAVTVTVDDVNEAPEITTTAKTVFAYRENGTAAVFTFSAADPEQSAVAWSAGGADSGIFAVARDSRGRGVLSFAGPPDFESPVDAGRDNVYEVTVEAADDQGLTDSVAVTVTVTDVNEGPAVSGPQSLSFTENQATDQILATYDASIPRTRPGRSRVGACQAPTRGTSRSARRASCRSARPRTMRGRRTRTRTTSTACRCGPRTDATTATWQSPSPSKTSTRRPRSPRPPRPCSPTARTAPRRCSPSAPPTQNRPRLPGRRREPTAGSSPSPATAADAACCPSPIRPISRARPMPIATTSMR